MHGGMTPSADGGHGNRKVQIQLGMQEEKAEETEGRGGAREYGVTDHGPARERTPTVWPVKVPRWEESTVLA